MLQLGSGNMTIVVLVKDLNTSVPIRAFHVGRGDAHLEGLSDLFLGIGVVHFPSHESHKLCKVDRVVSIRVDLNLSKELCLMQMCHTSLIISSSSAWVGF